MKKLFDLMQKYGLSFQKIDLGYSYFYGVPAVQADGAHIYIDDIRLPEWARFTRYCKRYGYDLKPWGGWPGCTVYSVCRADDAARLALYAEYMRQSVNAYTAEMNLRALGYFAGETSAEFNERLKGIMAFYESEYLKAMKQAAAA